MKSPARVERPEDRNVPDFIYDIEKIEKMRGAGIPVEYRSIFKKVPA
jgi:hypothetical protein